MRRLLGFAIVCMFVAAAVGQYDPNSVWYTYKGNMSRTASVVAPGPAGVIDWAVELPVVGGESAIVSPGGISLSGAGDLYYVAMDDVGSFVNRRSAVDGSELVRSVDLGGVVGNYSGVAVGVDKVYMCYFGGADNTGIVVLDKLTLAVLDTFTDVSFGGLRGTPLLSTLPNSSGNLTLFVADRNNMLVHAVDAVTGVLLDTQYTCADWSFGQMGPQWVTGEGRDAFAYFGNAPLAGDAWAFDTVTDTLVSLWSCAGPENFNWLGSGAMSADGTAIYVTTFNDGDTPSLWKISLADGSILWGVPGFRGDPLKEHNFFGRPAVLGTRVYCGGGWGVIACFEDLGNGPNDWAKKWEMRDGVGEFTSVSVAQAPGLRGGVYVYGSKQGLSEPDTIEKFVVLSDDGDSYTEIARHTLDQLTAQYTLYQNNSVTIDAEGSVYVALGSSFDEGVNPGAIYKFRVGWPCDGDIDGDGTTGHSDLGILLSDWGCPDEPVSLYDTGGWEAFAYGDLPGQDDWFDDTTNPEYGMVQVIDDPTGAGMGKVIVMDPPGITNATWLGCGRLLDTTHDQPFVIMEWDQYRDGLTDNCWIADDISFGGWWAIEWDGAEGISPAGYEGYVPLTAGVWQHITYVFDLDGGIVTVDVDGQRASAALSDLIIDGIIFQLEPTEAGGEDGPMYVDNFRIGQATDMICEGDLDGDGTTGHSDLGILLADWGCVE